METDTRALEVVCQHFRKEFHDETICNLRKRLNCAHVQNHRLRNKAQQLETQLKIERSCRAILDSVVLLLIKRVRDVVT